MGKSGEQAGQSASAAKANATSTSDVEALMMRMEADREALASRILSRLNGGTGAEGGSSSGSGASKKAKDATAQMLKQKMRPSSLGVGAKVPTPGAAQSNGTPALMQDVRLKGRLTANKRKREEDVGNGSTAGKGKGRAVDEEEDEEAEQKPSHASKKSKKNKDVFAAAAQKVQASKAAAVSAQSQPPDQGSTVDPLDGLDLTELSKKQRKKLRKRVADGATGDVLEGMDLSAMSGANQAALKERIAGLPAETDVPITPSAKEAPAKAAAKARAPSPSPQAPVIAPERTALQSQMATSLAGARFRHINEKLYTTTSQEALAMMREEPQMMIDYHNGFASQTTKWPVNPVERIAERLKALFGVATGKQNGKKAAAHGSAKLGGAAGRMLVADLGAGTAPLAKALESVPDVSVLSYDLLDSADGYVVGCDVGTRVPLPGRSGGQAAHLLAVAESATSKSSPSKAALEASLASGPEVIDVVVFSLSLMGKNWLNMVMEARRILKPGARLIVAEVTSRITDREAFTQVFESLGFTVDREDTSSQYFWLFEFIKESGLNPELLQKTPEQLRELAQEQARREQGLVKKAEALLKACLYKKR